jgi:hypothetical protein
VTTTPTDPVARCRVGGWRSPRFPAREQLGALDDKVRRSAHNSRPDAYEMAGADAAADQKNATAIAAGAER